MNIHLENVDIRNNSGPNSFGRKLVKYMVHNKHTFDLDKKADIALAFIQSNKDSHDVPLLSLIHI